LPLTLGGHDVDSVHAFGPQGAFLRWDEATTDWVSVPVPTDRTLVSGAVGGPDNLWAADELGSAWHFDGEAWTEAVADERILRVFIRPSGSVWAQSGAVAEAHGGGISGGALLRREGDAWVLGAEPYPFCQGGDYVFLDNDEIWTAGLVCNQAQSVVAAEVHRFDGIGWERVGETLSGASWYPHFQVVGDRVRVSVGDEWEWDGAAWQPFERPLPPQDLPVGQTAHWDGFGYTRVRGDLDCTDVFRVNEMRAWCSGAGQLYFHTRWTWQGMLDDAYAQTQPAESWGTLPTALWAGANTLRAWGSSPTNVYRVLTTGLVQRYDGSQWRGGVIDHRVYDVHGIDANDVWFATEQEPVQFDGRFYTPTPLPSEVAAPTLRVRATAPNAALVSTEKHLLRYDGEWSVAREAPGTRHIVTFAVRGEEIWVVEDIHDRSNQGFLAHFDGTAWRELSEPKVDVFGALAAAGDATWLYTADVVARLDGSVSAPVERSLTSPWAAELSADDGSLWLTTPKQARRYSLR
jgi:hypothetical protein